MSSLVFDLILDGIDKVSAEKRIADASITHYERDLALSKWRICAGKISTGVTL